MLKKSFILNFIILFTLLVFGIVSESNAQPGGKVHDNSISIITIGSGVPGGCFANRAEPMTVIQNKGRYIVLDCGYGSVLKLMKYKLPMANIDTIMLTHLHADHSSDFLNLMLWRFLYGGRKLDLVGPPRTGSYYKFFKNFYKDDIMYRAMVFNTGTTVGAFKGVKVREVKGKKRFRIGDITVESEAMVHCMYDLAYKFTIDGTTIVVTGDTSYTKKLVKFAKNTDMVVMDGSFILYALNPPKNYNFDVSGLLARKYDGKTYDKYKPRPYGGNFLVESHCNYADLIKICGEINPKKLLLTHLFHDIYGKGVDPQTDELKDKVRKDLKGAGFTGEVFFAEDGLEVGVKK